jgi:hypothetical protein
MRKVRWRVAPSVFCVPLSQRAPSTAEKELAKMTSKLKKLPPQPANKGATKLMAQKARAERYKRVRFFEKRKALRRLSRAQRRLKEESLTAEQRAEAQEELRAAKADMEYVTRFPAGMKYVSLYPNGADDDKEARLAAIAKIRALIAEDKSKKASEAEHAADDGAAPCASVGWLVLIARCARSQRRRF